MFFANAETAFWLFRWAETGPPQSPRHGVLAKCLRRRMLSAAGLDLEVEISTTILVVLLNRTMWPPISTLAQSGGGGGSIRSIPLGRDRIQVLYEERCELWQYSDWWCYQPRLSRARPGVTLPRPRSAFVIMCPIRSRTFKCFFGQCWATNPYPNRVELPRIDPWGSAPISLGVAVSL